MSDAKQPPGAIRRATSSPARSSHQLPGRRWARELCVVACFALFFAAYYRTMQSQSWEQQTWISLGDRALRGGQLDAAEDYYLMHILNYPTDGEVHNRLARVYLERDRSDQEQAARLYQNRRLREAWRDHPLLDAWYRFYRWLFRHIWSM